MFGIQILDVALYCSAVYWLEGFTVTFKILTVKVYSLTR